MVGKSYELSPRTYHLEQENSAIIAKFSVNFFFANAFRAGAFFVG